MIGAGADTSALLGTRFLLFPQPSFVPGYERPEVVWVSTPPGGLGSGPADARMYVADAAFDKAPYQFPHLPPCLGRTYPPAEAGPDGHFDHLEPGTRAFLAAHAFAATRRTIDVVESYFGAEIPWFFQPAYDRLEIVPLIDWDNAQSGFGFLELGLDRGAASGPAEYALNFDVVAHEIGHILLFGAMGLPSHLVAESDFAAFHEAAADLVSLIALLHFDTALDRILRRTRGNLLILNELDRIAELSEERQIRLASNSKKLGEVSGEVHDRSRPFTGAVFDTLVELYNLNLVARGLIPEETMQVPDDPRGVDPEAWEGLGEAVGAAYGSSHFAFKSALVEARDRVADVFVRAWADLDPDILRLSDAALAMLYRADARDPALAQRLEESFAWRRIL